MRLRPYLTLLRRNRAFSRLFAAQLVSFAGDWFATVAILGLALELTGSPIVASLFLVVQTGFFALASPVAGVLADRFDRRRLMVAVDVARVPAALAFLLARDPATLWVAFAATALLSFGAAVFEPTSSASLPNLVDDDELGEANVLIGSAWGTMLAVGAAAGGLVAAVFGRDIAFVANAASFAVSAFLIVGIDRPFRGRLPASHHHETPQGGLRGIAQAIGVVLRFARGNRTLAALLLSKTTFGVGTGVIVLLAVFGRDVFKAGDVGIGVLFAARGLGALIGPFLARSTVGLSERGLVLGIIGSFAAFALGYALLPAAPWLWLAAGCVFVAHLGGGAQWMLSSYGLQRAAPDEIRGRVFSFDYGLVTLTIAASTFLAGLLAESFPPAIAVWSIVALAATAALGWIAFSRPVWRRPYPSAAPAQGTRRLGSGEMRVYGAAEISEAVEVGQLLDAVEAAFRDVAAGRDQSPLRFHVPLANGDLLLMPGVREGGSGSSVKLVTVQPENAARGLPTVQAVVVWLDGETGTPVAVLDGTTVTAMRTGAASGVATRLLAREDAAVLAMLGTGGQAAWQVRAVMAARPISEIRAFSRDAAARERFAAEIGAQLGDGVRVVAAQSAEEAVSAADVVCCATTSSRPVFDTSWLRPGAHVNGVGAFRLGMVELPPGLFARAAVVAVDSRDAALAEAGDLVAAIDAGYVGADAFVEIGTIGRDWAATRDREAITVFKSVGLAIQDVAAAELVVQG